jgi:phosphoribosylformimino-5-aminoimidazole carboxamide ribotide isomerase
MKFRPCIDIHNGVVKQIVGSTLTENASDQLVENFVCTISAADFGELYRRTGLIGGHVIMLGGNCTDATLSALHAYPGGLQVGGTVTDQCFEVRLMVVCLFTAQVA